MHTLFRTLGILSVFLELISCSDSDHKENSKTSDSLPQFIKENVLLASGYVFDTGKPIPIDTFTGAQINPCAAIDTSESSKYSINKAKGDSPYQPAKGNQTCNIEVVSADASLTEALKSSESPILGKVKVNGEEKDAKFIVTVTALYKGSHCNTLFVGGQQWKNCVTKEAQCAALKKLGITC
jgi:hypothetical protein